MAKPVVVGEDRCGWRSCMQLMLQGATIHRTVSASHVVDAVVPMPDVSAVLMFGHRRIPASSTEDVLQVSKRTHSANKFSNHTLRRKVVMIFCSRNRTACTDYAVPLAGTRYRLALLFSGPSGWTVRDCQHHVKPRADQDALFLSKNAFTCLSASSR